MPSSFGGPKIIRRSKGGDRRGTFNNATAIVPLLHDKEAGVVKASVQGHDVRKKIMTAETE